MAGTKPWKKIFEEFKKWSPQHAGMVIEYRPWGNNSIAVWLSNGLTYKVKKYGPGKFTMQVLSEEEIKRKY